MWHASLPSQGLCEKHTLKQSPPHLPKLCINYFTPTACSFLEFLLLVDLIAYCLEEKV